MSKSAEQIKKWRLAHPEEDRILRKKYESDWILKHPEYETRGQYNYHNAKKEIIKVLGGKCKCGINDIRVLDIDHINGDGKKYNINGKRGIRAEFSGGMTGFACWVKQNPRDAKKRFQVLCANCHRIKTYENKEYK